MIAVSPTKAPSLDLSIKLLGQNESSAVSNANNRVGSATFRNRFSEILSLDQSSTFPFSVVWQNLLPCLNALYLIRFKKPFGFHVIKKDSLVLSI